jgi:transcriptional regulator with XRE-family HTH domain
MATPQKIITLDNVKSLRLTRGLKRSQLANITGIDDERLRDIELRRAEPWFDEALLLHRVLNTDGIIPLLSDYLTTSLDNLPRPTDRHAWATGLRAPLSLALRIATAFGLSDPAELCTTSTHRQLWAITASNERHPEAPGWCPWCAADIFSNEPHLPTCLGHNLFGLRGSAPATLAYNLAPAHKTFGQASYPGYGLLALREASGQRQADVAAGAGMGSDYYAKLERLEQPLTLRKADQLAAHFGVDRAVLYVKPGEEITNEPG